MKTTSKKKLNKIIKLKKLIFKEKKRVRNKKIMKKTNL